MEHFYRNSVPRTLLAVIGCLLLLIPDNQAAPLVKTKSVVAEAALNVISKTNEIKTIRRQRSLPAVVPDGNTNVVAANLDPLDPSQTDDSKESVADILAKLEYDLAVLGAKGDLAGVQEALAQAEEMLTSGKDAPAAAAGEAAPAPVDPQEAAAEAAEQAAAQQGAAEAAASNTGKDDSSENSVGGAADPAPAPDPDPVPAPDPPSPQEQNNQNQQAEQTQPDPPQPANPLDPHQNDNNHNNPDEDTR